MKTFIKILLIALFSIFALFLSTCGGPGTVSVGVGVGVGGPWVGPYGYPGGGTVWVGRPITPVYYHYDPLEDYGRQYVLKQDYRNYVENEK